MNFSIFENDGNLGQDAAAIRLLTFSWPNVRTRVSNQSLGQAHAVFNRRFTELFPRLLYTTPFTSYTNAALGITGSRLTGTCETVLSDNTMRSFIASAAAASGIDGNSNEMVISSHSIAALESGAVLNVPGSTVNPLATTDGVNALGSDLFEQYKWPLVIGTGIVVLLLIRR